MDGEKLANKNEGLGKLVYHLRQVIDMHRLIWLNTDSLKKRGLARNFFWAVQDLAHQSIALTICKIYDLEHNKHKLNSVYGLINEIKQIQRQYTNRQIEDIKQFGVSYENSNLFTNPHDFLTQTVELFKKKHELPLGKLRKSRNKKISHSELGYDEKSLSSHESYETLFKFAGDFHLLIFKLVNDDNVHREPFSSTVEQSLARLMKGIGVKNPTRQFPSIDASK